MMCLSSFAVFARDPCSFATTGFFKEHCDKKAAAAQKAEEDKILREIEADKGKAISDSLHKHGCRHGNFAPPRPPARGDLYLQDGLYYDHELEKCKKQPPEKKRDKKHLMRDKCDVEREERWEQRWEKDVLEPWKLKVLKPWEDNLLKHGGRTYLKDDPTDMPGRTCGQLYEALRQGLNEPFDPQQYID